MKSLIVIAALILFALSTKSQKGNRGVMLSSDTFFKGDTAYYFYYSENDHQIRMKAKLDLTFVNGLEYTRMSPVPLSLHKFYYLRPVFEWHKGKNNFKITLLPVESINYQYTLMYPIHQYDQFRLMFTFSPTYITTGDY